jgi:hypothetical protein
MQGLPAHDVTIKSCELLPHIFTLTLKCLAISRQLFSVALSLPDKSEAGSSPVHCSVLSGLSYLITQVDSLACSRAKVILFSEPNESSTGIFCCILSSPLWDCTIRVSVYNHDIKSEIFCTNFIK